MTKTEKHTPYLSMIEGLSGNVSGLPRGDWDCYEPLRHIVAQLAADAGEFEEAA